MQEVREVAARQHGLVTRSQLKGLGLPAGTFDEWARNGRLERVRTGVFALPGSAATDLRALTAAVLAAGEGVVVSHRSAAWLWGIREEPFLELSVPPGRRPRLTGVVVHRHCGAIRASRRRGLPVTDPLRTIIDLASVIPRPEVAVALEAALTLRLVSVRGVKAEIERCPGRRGVAIVRDLLEKRALGDRPAESALEAKFAVLLDRQCLPRAVFQHVVRDCGRFVARVDFAYPQIRLAIEIDGHATHSAPADLRRDLARQNRLMAAGWTVLRFTWFDVVHEPQAVAKVVRTQLEQCRVA